MKSAGIRRVKKKRETGSSNGWSIMPSDITICATSRGIYTSWEGGAGAMNPTVFGVNSDSNGVVLPRLWCEALI